MGMYSKRGAKSVQRALWLIEVLKNAAQPDHCTEMVRVQRQRMGQILKRGPVKPKLEIGAGPGVIAFGESGRVIDQRRQMVNRLGKIAGIHGLASAAQQQVHRRRSGF